jgi:hypothetical protein
VEGFLFISWYTKHPYMAWKAEIGGKSKNRNDLDKKYWVMSQITLLRSSGAGLEAFQASTLGVPMKQFRRNMIGIRWAKSTK